MINVMLLNGTGVNIPPNSLVIVKLRVQNSTSRSEIRGTVSGALQYGSAKLMADLPNDKTKIKPHTTTSGDIPLASLEAETFLIVESESINAIGYSWIEGIEILETAHVLRLEVIGVAPDKVPDLIALLSANKYLAKAI